MSSLFQWVIIISVILTIVAFHNDYENKKTADVFKRVDESKNKRQFEVDKFPNDKNVSKKISFLGDDYYGDRISLNQQVIEKLAKERNLSLYQVESWIYEEVDLLKALIRHQHIKIDEMKLKYWGHSYSNQKTFFPYEYYLDLCIEKKIPFKAKNIFEKHQDEVLYKLAARVVTHYPDYYNNLPEEYKKNKNIIAATKKGINSSPSKKSKISSKALFFSNKNVAITGKLEHFIESDLVKLIGDYKGNYTKSINHKTDILITGTNPGLKAEIAKQRGVMLISETELL
jgi:NAD-dependent DNA ligase